MTEPIPGITDDNGTTFTDFAAGELPRDNGSRIPAFIGLARESGGRYAENLEGMSLADALAAVGLDFTVTKVPFTGLVTQTELSQHPISGIEAAPTPVSVSGPSKLRLTVATFPPTGAVPRRPVGLGVVGKDYGVVQPQQAGEFAQQVLDEAGATVAAVCAYGDPQCSRMLLALRLPSGLLIGGVDPHDVYLVIGNSFNSETSLWGCAAPLRIDCTNQLAGTFGRVACRFKISHSSGVDDRVDEVRRTLDITRTFAQQYASAAEELLTAPMSHSDVDAFVAKMLPTPADIKTVVGAMAWDGRRALLAKLIRNGERNTVGRGTRYAGLQAATEFADHYVGSASARTRYARIVAGGQVERFKSQAAKLLLSGV